MVNLTETWQQCLTDNVYSNDTVHISVSTKQLCFCSYLVRSPKAYDFNCLFAEICKEKANENMKEKEVNMQSFYEEESILTKEYICDRRDSTNHSLTKMRLTQPLPALSAVYSTT